MKYLIVLFISSTVLADARNVIGNTNKLTPDPALGEVKRETQKLRQEINDLDKPLKGPIEKTPNQIIEEKKQEKKSVPR